ncbi:hypothetical protein ABPG75_002968 [Micractinium tetrahymenae]
MASRDVSAHPVAEEQPKGVLGKVREVLGLGGGPSEAQAGVSEYAETYETEHAEASKERVAGPGTPSRVGPIGAAPSKETAEAWRAAQAETVRAEHAARRAEEVAAEADRLAAEAAAAKGLSADAARLAEEIRSQQAALDQEARLRMEEASELERQLQQARQMAEGLERQRLEHIEEARRIQQPVEEMNKVANRLSREAQAARNHAMDLERAIQAVRSGKPMQKAARKEEEARRLAAEMTGLQQQAAGNEEDAKRTQSEAERLQEVIDRETIGADELARQYWGKRDILDRLKQEMKALVGEAAAEARDAEKKYVTAERMVRRVEKAAHEAELALQKKAEQEKQAYELLSEKESEEQRAARLEQEAAARRAAAGEREEEAVRVEQKAEVVVKQGMPDTSGLEKQAAEAVAEKDREMEHWDNAKQLGDLARAAGREEVERRMAQVDESQLTAETTAATTATTAKEERTSTGASGAATDPSAADDVHSGEPAANIFKAGQDVGEAPTELEAQGHETAQQHSARRQSPGATDAELLREEGADLPQRTRAGNVELPGAGES